MQHNDLIGGKRIKKLLDKQNKEIKEVESLVLKIVDSIIKEIEVLEKNNKKLMKTKDPITKINSIIQDQLKAIDPFALFLVYRDVSFWEKISTLLDFEKLINLELYHAFNTFFYPLSFYFKFIDYKNQFSPDKIAQMMRNVMSKRQYDKALVAHPKFSKFKSAESDQVSTVDTTNSLLAELFGDLYVFEVGRNGKILPGKPKDLKRIKNLELIRKLTQPIIPNASLDNLLKQVTKEKFIELITEFPSLFLAYVNHDFLKKFLDTCKKELNDADLIFMISILNGNKNNCDLINHILDIYHPSLIDYSLKKIQETNWFKNEVVKSPDRLYEITTESVHPLFNVAQYKSTLDLFVFYLNRFKEDIFKFKNEKNQNIFEAIVEDANIPAVKILFWKFPQLTEQFKNQSPSPLFSLVRFEADEDTTELKKDKKDFIKFLIDKGFSVNCVDKNTSLLNYIIKRNDKETLEFILSYLEKEKKEDISSYINPSEGIKPLMQAGLSNDHVIFEYLANKQEPPLSFDDINNLLKHFFYQKLEKQEKAESNSLNLPLLEEIINYIKKHYKERLDILFEDIWIKNIETFQIYRSASSDKENKDYIEIATYLQKEIDLRTISKNGLNLFQLLVLRGPATGVHEFLKSIEITGSDVISFKLLRFALMGDPENALLFNFLLNKIDGKDIEKLNEKIEPDSLDKISYDDIKKIAEQQRNAGKEYIWPMTGELTITERRRLMPKNKMEYYLLSAFEYQRADIVKALLAKNIKVDMLDKADKGALWYAIQYGYADLIKSLYEKGALFDAATSQENSLAKMLVLVNEKILEAEQKNLASLEEIKKILLALQKEVSPILKKVESIPVEQNKTETLELEEKAKEVDSLSQAIIIPEIENEVGKERKRAKVFSYQKREKQAKEENQSSSLPKNISSIFSQPPTGPIKMFLKNAGEYSRLLEGNTMDWNNCNVFIPQAFLESVNAREIGNLKELFAVRFHINEHHGIKRLAKPSKKIELWLDDNKLGEGLIVAELKGGGKHRIFFIKMGDLLIGALYSPGGAHGNAQSIHQDVTRVTFKSSLMPWNLLPVSQNRLG